MVSSTIFLLPSTSKLKEPLEVSYEGVKEEVKANREKIGKGHVALSKAMDHGLANVVKGQTDIIKGTSKGQMDIMDVIGADSDKVRRKIEDAIEKAADKIVKNAQELNYDNQRLY